VHLRGLERAGPARRPSAIQSFVLASVLRPAEKGKAGMKKMSEKSLGKPRMIEKNPSRSGDGKEYICRM
jgi:hypothetical protein